MTESTEDIRIKRMIKNFDGKKGNSEQLNLPDPRIVEMLYRILFIFQEMECPTCHQLLPKVFFCNVRGELKCFRCHYDATRDYGEENRRQIDKLKKEIEKLKQQNSKRP